VAVAPAVAVDRAVALAVADAVDVADVVDAALAAVEVAGEASVVVAAAAGSVTDSPELAIIDSAVRPGSMPGLRF